MYLDIAPTCCWQPLPPDVLLEQRYRLAQLRLATGLEVRIGQALVAGLSALQKSTQIIKMRRTRTSKRHAFLHISSHQCARTSAPGSMMCVCGVAGLPEYLFKIYSNISNTSTHRYSRIEMPASLLCFCSKLLPALAVITAVNCEPQSATAAQWFGAYKKQRPAKS